MLQISNKLIPAHDDRTSLLYYFQEYNMKLLTFKKAIEDLFHLPLRHDAIPQMIRVHFTLCYTAPHLPCQPLERVHPFQEEKCPPWQKHSSWAYPPYQTQVQEQAPEQYLRGADHT